MLYFYYGRNVLIYLVSGENLIFLFVHTVAHYMQLPMELVLELFRFIKLIGIWKFKSYYKL